jgi:anthraniloyl-CoA monooxygenase
MMKINIVGGGPAGLYFAILMKKLSAENQITIFERDGPNDTFGWGIVFSDQTFAYLQERDHKSYVDIVGGCEIWDNVDVVHQGRKITIRGNIFSGIGRLAFLNILQRRCLELGIEIKFHTNVTNVEDLAACDLLVGADGANSLVRRTYEKFLQPSVDLRKNKYIWLGTHRLFHGLTLTFRQSPDGLFIAHSYKFNKTTSTFIVECSEETWRKSGLESMPEQQTCNYLAEVFSDDLDGHELLTNNFVRWLNFPLVRNGRWSHNNMVLMGDALHTAHFSIGSGTKLALEDAIALASCFENSNKVGAALSEFERVRKPVVTELQEAAFSSLYMFENADDDVALDPIPFAYKLMTRSKKIDYEKLKKRDPDFAAQYENWQSSHTSSAG